MRHALALLIPLSASRAAAATRPRLPLISATRDLQTALSWGYGGCHPIVAINVQAAAAAHVRAYDMGGSLNNLCWSGMAQNFAASSAEVVFDGDIPAHCITVLQVGWTCARQHALPRSMSCSLAAGCTHLCHIHPTQLLFRV